MLALSDVPALACPAHRLVRLGREDALVNQDQVVRLRAEQQVLLQDLQLLLVSDDEIRLVRPPLGSADAHHLVLDCKPAVGRAQVVHCPRW